MTEGQLKKQTETGVVTDAVLRSAIRRALKQTQTTKWTVVVRQLRKNGCMASAGRIVKMLRSEFDFAPGQRREDIAKAAAARRAAVAKAQARADAKAARSAAK